MSAVHRGRVDPIQTQAARAISRYQRSRRCCLHLGGGDFNGDGIADLAVADIINTVSILLANSDRT